MDQSESIRDRFGAAAAAYAFADPADDPDLHQRFQRLDFVNPVWPGTTVSGFVLTNLDELFSQARMRLEQHVHAVLVDA